MIRKFKQGQSTLEFSVLIAVILGAILSMQIYTKRGIQGRFKSAVDDLGDQYDPRFSETLVEQTLISNSISNIYIQNTLNGTSTMREDQVSSLEIMNSTMTTAPE